MLLMTAIRNLRRSTRRTLTILLTVAVGTFSLFIYQGFNTGIMNQYRENTIHAFYGFGQIFTEGYRSQAYEKPWEHWIENYDEVAGFLKDVPGVTDLFPRVNFSALLTNGSVNVGAWGLGVDGPREAKFFNFLSIIEGKALEDEADGIVLGKGLARALAIHPGDRVTLLGQTVNGTLNGTDLIVTGIFETGNQTLDDTGFKIQLEQAHQLLDTHLVERVALGLDSLESWDRVSQAMEQKFPELESVSFDILDKVYYQHSVDWLGAQFQVIRMIILSIVVLGIFNTVSTAILERKNEIGNLRANGESSWDIMRLLLLEGMVLGVLGAIIGVAMGMGFVHGVIPDGILMPPAPGITKQFHVRVELQFWQAISNSGLGIACALMATAFAGSRVARMGIGDALRSL